jgi:peroxiredoxin
MCICKRATGTILFLIFGIALVSGCLESSDNNSDNGSNGGIDFSFTTIQGEEKHLSDYRGNIVVVDLMGVMCQPCQAQMYELKKVSENYSHQNVEIISIDVWVFNGETADLVHQLIEAFDEQVNLQLDWTFALDDAQGTIFQQYTQGGVPSLHIIDTKGNIYYSHYSYTDYATLASKLDELIG